MPIHFFHAFTEARKHGTLHKGTFQLCQSLVNGLYLSADHTELALWFWRGQCAESSYFKTRTYQKLCFNSFHLLHSEKAFIRGELIPYVKSSLECRDYRSIRTLFWTRLRRRRYTAKFLEPVFESVKYNKCAFYIIPRMKAFDLKKRSVCFETSYSSNHLRIWK